MTGKELVELIQKHDLEDKTIGFCGCDILAFNLNVHKPEDFAPGNYPCIKVLEIDTNSGRVLNKTY
jgi:hypothetical protein